MKSLAIVTILIALSLAGCSAKTEPTATDNRNASPTTPARGPDGGPQQIVSQPGRYTVGKDIEAGSWVGMARNTICVYRTIRQVDGNRQKESRLDVVGSAPITGEDGFPIGRAIYFGLKAGDLLELVDDEYGFDFDTCVFWNDSTDTPAVPADSDLPWRDVDKTILGADKWKIGQFDYLDQVKTRVQGFDETDLTEMGLWSCALDDRGAANLTLRKFADLTEIQADYLITTASKNMCPDFK